jgi:transcription-repair coupling factor (superfamily II helicase)
MAQQASRHRPSRLGVFMASPSTAEQAVKRIADEIHRGKRVLALSGLTSVAAKAYFLSDLRRVTEKNFVIVTASNTDLDAFECDLKFWNSKMRPDVRTDSAPMIMALPSFETDVYSGASPHAETQERRASTLWQLTREIPEFLVATARSLIVRTAAPTEIGMLGAYLRADGQLEPNDFIGTLISAGYVREDPVSGVGQFSVRGGIVDVWSPTSDYPVRVEFFGDTIDSIREFDPETQLSVQHPPSASIAPMREFAISADDLKDWARAARQRFFDSRFSRNLSDRTDFAVEGETFSGWEFLLPISRPLTSTAFDYLPADALFIIDEPATIESTLSHFYEHLRARFRETVEIGDIGAEPDELFLNEAKLRERLDTLSRIELRSLGWTAAATDEDFALGETKPLFLFPTAEKATELQIPSRSTRKFGGDIREFADRLGAANDSQSTVIVVKTEGIAERLSELLHEYDVAGQVREVAVGDISGGFEFPSAGLVVYSESDIFGETAADVPVARSRPRRSNLGAFISDFRDLKEGDYVVHVDHGIGRFDGLQMIQTGGMEREFMLLVYADNAKLFVPVERLDLVSRYSSGEATAPSLDRLGGLGWQKTKAKAKRAMRDMADELLRLYAERKLVRGHAFPPDAPWQREFEDAFPYDLTTDQANAITDVKEDMETPSPMDRLIIGDVGYGKTEVAMRAAFKAVMDGRQVAVLAPTTVLAYQHFETFTKRFAAFPAKIDLLSRFRSKKEQKIAVDDADRGNTDVLIGTHRILSNDVKLPKLGLVVVDEEQRFGVAHKEKLKQLKKKVDVLTLSATPIPRTLNMSLLGMRDMSVIETPPRDRLAINTQVVQFSEGVIASAIELELARNGQVFFVHNRVETIEAIAALVQKIVPNARIAIGHGQMNEKEMEHVMLDFIDYKYDILIATTIIENGIDIPRANTIIINRADNYGLSQLYQLRGRVGRSNRRAYAYLLIPSELELTPIARRRLSAIREFSDLGAGFRLAALDLELRGAGNILGGQQSGHLDALGFDLYTKMLERTIAELRGDEIADETSVSINVGVDVSIPQEYISEAGQRLRTYKRISSAETESELVHIHTELEDRYGRIPTSVDNLFRFGRVRKLAERMRLVSIDRSADALAIKLAENARVLPEKLMEVLAENEGSSFSPSGILRVGLNGEDPLVLAQQVLERIQT